MLGGVFIFYEECNEDFLYLFFSFSFRYFVFVHRSCDHLVIANLVSIWYIFDEVVITFFHLSIHVFFSFLYLCTCFLLIVCNLLYFYFTLRCHNEFCLKCFRNTSCQSLPCHELSCCKVFQEFVLGLDFIVFNKWIWVKWFMTSLIFYLFVVVLS